MCSDTLNPGGEVRGCSVGCILGMPEISPFVFIAAANRYMGFLELWVRRNFVFFECRTKVTVGTCPFVSHEVSI